METRPRSEIVASKLKEAKEHRFSRLELEEQAQVDCLGDILSAWRKLENLRSLTIKNGQLDTLQHIITRIPNLFALQLSYCRLSSFPSFVLNIPKLSYLGLAGNELSELPQQAEDLRKLTGLDLQGNKFKSIPELVFNLERLQTLNLGDNIIDEELSNGIGKLRNLKSLSLYRMGLKSLPVSMRYLENLSELLLWNNRFKSIPPVVYELRALERLSFSNDSTTDPNRHNNSISVVPPEILQLENLKKLDLKANPIQDPPPEVVAKGPQAIRNYFKQIERKGKDYLFEAKLLIVGEGGAGKTTLARKINNEAYALREEDSTKGIEVTRWVFLMGSKQTFRVNTWDFGGQEIYHSTHQFFLTRRSLYVLVADARKEDTDFHYWLNVVSLLSDNSPVLIVKNEKQDRHKEINEPSLRGQFPNIIAILATNLATNRGLADVKQQVKKSIQGLPHIGTAIPKTWVTVREALENDYRNFISVDEFLEICSRNGFKTTEDKYQLSGYLHDLGVCLHFQDDPILRRWVILKPKWGTDAVYKVLDSPAVIEAMGRFGPRDLEKIWGAPEYLKMQVELLQLMTNFRLCYKIRDSDFYMAPQLLTENHLQYEWSDRQNLMLRYTYHFMPKGILTQFIVAMHPFIVQQKYVWKSGVLLERDGARAEVLEQYGKREISVRVGGKSAAELLAIVAYELDRIHATYKGLQFTKLIPCNCNACEKSADPHFYPLETLRKFTQDRQDLIQCHKSYEMVRVHRLLTDVNVPSEQAGGEVSQFVFQGPVAKVVVHQRSKEVSGMVANDQSPSPGRSAWANGSFYLFTLLSVAAAFGVLARTVPIYVLPAVLIAAILVVPLIGVLQLRQDDRIKDKPFLEVMRLVIRQLPLVGKKAHQAQERAGGP